MLTGASDWQREEKLNQQRDYAAQLQEQVRLKQAAAEHAKAQKLHEQRLEREMVVRHTSLRAVSARMWTHAGIPLSTLHVGPRASREYEAATPAADTAKPVSATAATATDQPAATSAAAVPLAWQVAHTRSVVPID